MKCWRCGHDLVPEAYLLRCPVCDWTETRVSQISTDQWRALRDTATELVTRAAVIAGDEPMPPEVIQAVQKLQDIAENADNQLQGRHDENQ